MNKKIDELLHELGEALKEDALVKEYQEAKKEYAEHPEVAAMINEFNSLKIGYQGESRKEDKDEHILDTMNEKIEELKNSILANPYYTKLADAEDNLNAFLNQISGYLMSCVAGESSCGGNCSSCGGGCSCCD